MPYIKREDRPVLKSLVEDIVREVKEHHDFDTWGGKLNYVVSLLLTELFDLSHNNARYLQLQTAIGILECVKLELYRRRGTAIEESARERNGEIV
jgi:hypothetical protein